MKSLRQPSRETMRYSTQMPPEAIRHSAFRVLAAMYGPDRWQTQNSNSREFVESDCQPKGGWHVYRPDSKNRVTWLINSSLRIHNMNKLIAALVAGLFASAAFAQASAPEAASAAPAAAASAAHKSSHKKAHKKSSHKKAAKAEAASAASE
jgi:hypothetical protein